MSKKDESIVQAAEVRLIRTMVGKSRRDKIRNKKIKDLVQVGRL